MFESIDIVTRLFFKSENNPYKKRDDLKKIIYASDMRLCVFVRIGFSFLTTTYIFAILLMHFFIDTLVAGQ